MPTTTLDPARTRRLLRLVAIAAAIDFLLLVPLLIASFSNNDELVSVLGPIHGFGYLVQLFLTGMGAVEKRWGWWFPAIVVVTLGPPGALIGHVKVSRELDAASAQTEPA
jgi:integral membrane protein